MRPILHIWKPSTPAIAPHHELVQAFYSADLDSLHTPDPSMREIAAKVSQIVGFEVPAQTVMTVELAPEEAGPKLAEIGALAYVEEFLVFLDDAGLFVNTAGTDLQETFAPVELASSTGTVWRQVGERIVDIAFEDALRAQDPVGAWLLLVTTYADSDSFGGSVSMCLEADGQWLMTLRYTATESGEEKPAQQLRVGTYEEARSILLAFADICGEIHELDWQEAAPDLPGLRRTAYGQNIDLPLRRLDAVADLPAGTMMRLHDPYWGELRYGRTRDGAWNATQVRSTGIRVSRDFGTLEEVMAVARAFSKGNGHSDEVKAAFGGDIQALSVSMWSKDVVEVTAMPVPHRGAAWMNSTIRFLHSNRAQRNQPASAQMEDFVAVVNHELGDFLVDGPVEPAELTRMRLRNPGAVPQLFSIAEGYAVSIVVNGEHVLYNPSGKLNEGVGPDAVRVFNNGLPFQGWKVNTLAAFDEAIDKVANSCQLSVFTSGPVGTRGHYGKYETCIFENENGLAARLYCPDGTVYAKEKMHVNDASLIYSIANDVERVTDPSLWQSSTKLPVLEERRFVQVIRWNGEEYATQFLPVSLENLRKHGFAEPGDRCSILDLSQEDAFAEIRYSGDSDDMPFEGECRFTGEDGWKRNYKIRSAGFQKPMDFLELFATGDYGALERFALGGIA
ncbi:hypothetical protein M3G18_00565 [Corynebacterium sp. p3-SID1145]|uniref:hypothetical protein n=1 Tax=unclassified Corynebacterium TaxID=2624378 RepID=UPI0021AA8CB5|nr:MULTISPECIES: hypothetical protein [unclassified Corynebacterium]MCT1451417.1 hypothetical protein [Corynebacterium sp. p3-SID1145]MCT1460576.1 hypothetical protein [Corynebacterium sp. p3-SID1140]